VTRPEYALVRAAEKDNTDRVTHIGALVRTLGPDRELLDVLLDRASLSAPEREAVRRSVRP
jgi:hypothetical protein